MDLDKLVARIKQEEGFSPYSFWDDAKGGGGKLVMPLSATEAIP